MIMVKRMMTTTKLPQIYFTSLGPSVIWVCAASMLLADLCNTDDGRLSTLVVVGNTYEGLCIVLLWVKERERETESGMTHGHGWNAKMGSESRCCDGDHSVGRAYSRTALLSTTGHYHSCTLNRCE